MITVASMITISRIVLTPVVVYFLLQHSWALATIIFLVAAATDLVDGYVARAWGQQSRLGQLLDPVADKCLLMSTMFTLLSIIAVQPWHRAAVIFLLVKESILLVGGAILITQWRYFIEPSRLSRAASLGEIVLIVTMLGSLTVYGFVFPELISALLVTNVALSVWLLARYGMHLWCKRWN